MESADGLGDSNLRITLFNAEAEQMFGYERAELIGKLGEETGIQDVVRENEFLEKPFTQAALYPRCDRYFGVFSQNELPILDLGGLIAIQHEKCDWADRRSIRISMVIRMLQVGCWPNPRSKSSFSMPLGNMWIAPHVALKHRANGRLGCDQISPIATTYSRILQSNSTRKICGTSLNQRRHRPVRYRNVVRPFSVTLPMSRTRTFSSYPQPTLSKRASKNSSLRWNARSWSSASNSRNSPLHTRSPRDVSHSKQAVIVQMSSR